MAYSRGYAISKEVYVDIVIDIPAWGRALAGGLMIGVSALLLMAGHGRIAGISGVVGGVLSGEGRAQGGWRIFFLVGLIAGAAAVQLISGSPVTTEIPASIGVLALAGLLVGVGTRMGSGCTSGHGVCGLGRRSARSLVSTFTFMAVGIATVFLMRHGIGG